MYCTSCQKSNLPGGVRCSYCGVHFPPSIEFDLGQRATPIVEEAAPGSTARGAGLVGLLAFLALKAKFFLGLLKFGKLVTTLGSMLIFILADVKLFGWSMAVGLGVSILIHEMGHVYVNWRKGIEQSAPMFIPFVGALIVIKKFPDNPVAQAESGAGGPIAGGLAAFVSLGIWIITKQPFWLSLAMLGFAINLFNLIPFPPLDGSHISQPFSRSVWNSVLLVLVLVGLKIHAPTMWIVVVVGFIFRLGLPKEGRFLLAPVRDRWRMAAVYVVLVLSLSAGLDFATAHRAGIAQKSSTTQSTAVRAKPGLSSSATQRTSKSQNGSAISPIITAFLILVVVVVTLLIPVSAASLLAACAKNFRFRHVVASVIALYASIGILIALNRMHLLTGTISEHLIYGWYAGILTIAFYGGYHLWHGRIKNNRLEFSTHAFAAIAYAFCSSAMVGYGFDDWTLCLLSLLTAVGVILARPWRRHIAQGRWARLLGNHSLATTHLSKAEIICPDSVVCRELRGDIYWSAMNLGHGSVAMQVLGQDARDSEGVALQYMRAAALAECNRFEDAISQVERILTPRGNDPWAKFALPLANSMLARIALYRGWNDEALTRSRIATIPHYLGEVSHHSSFTRVFATCIQTPLELEAGLSELNYFKYEPMAVSVSETVRCVADLALNHHSSALEHATKSTRIVPDNLSALYYQACAFLANGKQSEGRAQLSKIANFSKDHWPTMAARKLEEG